jgi:uncharacterized membrane protein
MHMKRNRLPLFMDRIRGKKLISLTFGSLLLALGLLAGYDHLATSLFAAEITYPVSQFNDGKAKFYTYKTVDGVTIKYFILKSSDGVIRAAFDACDVCWPEGKGYRQQGDFMVCNNCGKRFASVNVNVITGGCNPGALTRKVVGTNLIIQPEDLNQGKRYFTFKGGKG